MLFLGNVDKLTQCQVLSKMNLNSKCLSIYNEFFVVINSTFSNMKQFKSIQDLIAPWSVFSNTVIDKIKSNCFGDDINDEIKQKLIDSGENIVDAMQPTEEIDDDSKPDQDFGAEFPDIDFSLMTEHVNSLYDKVAGGMEAASQQLDSAKVNLVAGFGTLNEGATNAKDYISENYSKLLDQELLQENANMVYESIVEKTSGLAGQAQQVYQSNFFIFKKRCE